MGASRHVARIVRAALNVRYSKDVMRELGLAVASFDMAHEPGGVSTMEWGTRTAIDTYRKLHNRVADAVYDLSVVGKEPMVRLMAYRAVDAGGQGHIVRSGGWVWAVGCPAMGASGHVAKTVLAAMHHDGELRAALNIRYSKDVLKDTGLAVASFDIVRKRRLYTHRRNVWSTSTFISMDTGSSQRTKR